MCPIPWSVAKSLRTSADSSRLLSSEILERSGQEPPLSATNAFGNDRSCRPGRPHAVALTYVRSGNLRTEIIIES